MDQKRLLLAISLSLAILVIFQVGVSRFLPHPAPQPAPVTAATSEQANANTAAQALARVKAAQPGGAEIAPDNGPRLTIDAPKLAGSLSLDGAVLDDVTLKDYRDTIDPHSPLVQILGRRSSEKPYYVQFGWNAAAGGTFKVPDGSTRWTASAAALTPRQPVTLSWDNGAGLTFQIVLAIDDGYMFTVQQKLVNHTGAPVSVTPWALVSRDYKPVDQQTSYMLHEGPVGVLDGRLKEPSYSSVKSDGARAAGGAALDQQSKGGWLGITDKYWLTAIIPPQNAPATGAVRYLTTKLGAGFAYQTDFTADQPITVAPGATGAYQQHLFTGAKVVKTLEAYGKQYNIPLFYDAVDFGWFWFLTRPIFFALDWLNNLFGNFGLAILAFTVFVKALFFPLANYSYRSMSKMKLVGPKVQEIRKRLKDDPQKQQAEIMGLYKTEKVNPASGCLPMIVQVPVFFALYKVIYVTIEMRHAPFYGWIRDLSAEDPTNIFNLFGLIPFDPGTISPFLHLGLLPVLMGGTMYLQQRLNPAPPDPVQAKMFQFMPVIFTFMMGRFPAGLVLYWTWNNLLSVAQQWVIMRRMTPKKAKALSKA